MLIMNHLQLTTTMQGEPYHPAPQAHETVVVVNNNTPFPITAVIKSILSKLLKVSK